MIELDPVRTGLLGPTSKPAQMVDVQLGEPDVAILCFGRSSSEQP